MKWDSTCSLHSPLSLTDVFKNKTGGASDINHILINLLRDAGIQADPVALSTRENGQLIPSFPSISKLNYIITRVTINGKQILLDATDPELTAGMLPVRCAPMDRVSLWMQRNGPWVDLATFRRGYQL